MAVTFDMSGFPAGGEFRFFVSDTTNGDAVAVGSKMELAGWQTAANDILKVAWDKDGKYFKVTGYNPSNCNTCNLTIQVV